MAVTTGTFSVQVTSATPYATGGYEIQIAVLR
jgi:hypothetical protein